MRSRSYLLSLVCTVEFLVFLNVGTAWARTAPATPITSARSSSLQISSVFIDDEREEAFVFPHRLGSETEITAFDISGGSTLALLGGERWRFAWATRSVTSSGTHQSLIATRAGRHSRVGLSVGGSTNSTQSDNQSERREREDWTWHVSAGLGMGGERSQLDLCAGVTFSEIREDRLTSDDENEELTQRTLGKDDPRAFLQLRWRRSYQDARLLLAGGFFDQSVTWDLRDLRRTPPARAELDTYGHAWYAGFLLAKETSRRATARFSGLYRVDREPDTEEVEGEYTGRHGETRRGDVTVSIERRIVRRLLGRVAIGRSYTFSESEGGPQYSASWASADSFAWGLEYAHRWIRLSGLLRYDLGLDEPFVAIDVSLRP